MKKRATLILLAFILLTKMSLAESAFKSYVPNGSKFSCVTCHISTDGGKNWNKFGNEIKMNHMSAGKPKWSTALANLDSDGDGKTNGQELQDPTGSWSNGKAQPGTLSLVTNPGDANSFSGVEDLILAKEFIEINSIYPNPANENSQVDFRIKEAGNIKIDIFGLNGNFIENVTEEYLESGDYTLKLPLKNLNNGVYYLKLSIGHYPVFYKFVVNK